MIASLSSLDLQGVSPTSLIAYLALALGFLGLIYQYLLEPLYVGPLAHVPGPKLAALSWYYLTYYDILLCRNEKISDWHTKYGPVVRIRPNEVTVADPADYREIYDTKTKYDKTKFFKIFTMYGEDNLFSTEKYADHQVMKRKFATAYTKSNVVATAEGTVRERVAAVLREMIRVPNHAVDFFVLFDCYAHDVMTRFLYGVTHGTDTIEDPAERPLVVNLKRSQIWSPLWVNFGWLHGSWLLKLIMRHDYERNFEAGADVKEAIERKLAEHDADPEKDATPSLYRTLRRAKTDGEPLSRNYMASEMIDHLKAGQQTTASTLTYIAWRLARHAEWQDRLQKEVRALPIDDAANLSLNDLEACPVLNAVIRETLRLHPAASGRQERIVPPGGHTYAKGIFLPGGTVVIGPTLVLHHNPQAFPDPHVWYPGRWPQGDKFDPSEEKLKEMEFSFAPFGHGARICIGQHLAMMELRLLVANIYRRFTLSLSDTCTDYEMYQLGTLAAVPRGLRCELWVEKGSLGR